jgi:hypothetical protein
MSDITCSEPGASGYSYNGLAIRAYHESSTKMRTVLPTDADGVVSSYLLSISKASGAVVDIQYFAATSDPQVASTLASTEVVRSEGLGVTGPHDTGSAEHHSETLPPPRPSFAFVQIAGTYTVAGKAILETTGLGSCPAGSYVGSSDCVAW